jgi:hypothetical protein
LSKVNSIFTCFWLTEFKSPVRYIPSSADTVNELLFDLLTRQLSQLGLQEVILQDNDCRELLKNLELQAASECPLKDDDFPNNNGKLIKDSIKFWFDFNIFSFFFPTRGTLDPDTEVDSFATAREAITPRSPRDINLSNPPSR